MYLKLKRGFDFILALIGVIILLPVFLIIIIVIKIDSKGPVLFKQKRVEIHKKHFSILKFRTMRIDTSKDTPTHQEEKVYKFFYILANVFCIITSKMHSFNLRKKIIWGNRNEKSNYFNYA